MSNSSTQALCAAHLDSLGLDRAATIQEAATAIADLLEQLEEMEARAVSAEALHHSAVQRITWLEDFLNGVIQDVDRMMEAYAWLRRELDLLPERLESLGEVAMQTGRRLQAFDNAQKKLAADPKQMAKREIRERWVDWIFDAPHHYSDNSDFANAMQKEYNHVLNSITQISQWCGEWSKEFVHRCWIKFPRQLSSEEKNKFAKVMKACIKTLRPHDVIRWSNDFENTPNPPS